MGCQLTTWEWWKHPFRFGLVFHSPPPLLSVFMSWGEAHSSPLPIFLFFFVLSNKNLVGCSPVTLISHLYSPLPTSDLTLPFKTIQALWVLCVLNMTVWQERFREVHSATGHFASSWLGQKPFQPSWAWGKNSDASDYHFNLSVSVLVIYCQSKHITNYFYNHTRCCMKTQLSLGVIISLTWLPS